MSQAREAADAAEQAPSLPRGARDRRRSIRLSTRAIVALYATAAVAMALWTISPSFRVLAAVATLGRVREALPAKGPLEEIPTKQLVQRHFRQYGAHIEFQDIVLQTSDAISPQSQVYFTKRTCGEARVYLYVAFPYRLPIYGERVTEWCMRLDP